MKLCVTMNVGDLVHQLFAVKAIYETTNEKQSVVFIWDDSVTDIFDDCKSLVMRQEYIKSFDFVDSKSIDPKIEQYIKSTDTEKPIENIETDYFDICLGDFRQSSLLYRAGWTYIYCDRFNLQIPNKPNKWLTVNPLSGWEDVITVHMKTKQECPDFPWNEFIERFGERYKFVFVGFSDEQYNLFPHKTKMTYFKTKSMEELAEVISSSVLFIGNLASPLSIAHALDTPRLVVLPEWPDYIHYTGDIGLTDNLYYYMNNNFTNMQSITHL